jgi:hypothetical protein
MFFVLWVDEMLYTVRASMITLEFDLFGKKSKF